MASPKVTPAAQAGEAHPAWETGYEYKVCRKDSAMPLSLCLSRALNTLPLVLFAFAAPALAAEAPPAPPRMLPGRCFRSREVGGSERASIVVPLNCVNRHHVTRGFRPGREWLHGAPIRAQRAPLQAGRLVLSSRSPREELLGQSIAKGSSTWVREGVGARRSRKRSWSLRSRRKRRRDGEYE